ncbi:hypothetical protein ACFX15_022202 [Malus domestica]|uniref:Prolamin-like domain-containing protein n=2 Tax=Malus domestica TaxID=3750 RepID=A0A498HH74_MALDO|nr:hypothetical protein DVH24_015448 [Malus domestica]
MASFGNAFVMPGLVLAAIIVVSSARLSSASEDVYGNYADRDEPSSISPSPNPSPSPSPSTTEDISSSSSNFPDVLPPEPSQGYYRHLRKWADEISPLCAEQIFEGMFYSNEELTEDCCANLLHVGYECHRVLVKLILLEPTFKGKASEALHKSFQIWSKCVVVVHQTDSPSPTAAAVSN